MSNITYLSFPDLRLATRDASKLRGSFGTLFKKHSVLLHNHFEDGSFRYKYPLVQYKVINNIPTLVGIDEGGKLLLELFIEINEIEIEGQLYPLIHKQLKQEKLLITFSEQMHRYRFETLYMALNQKNYAKLADTPVKERPAALNKILRSHLLAMLKGIGVWLEADQRILVDAQLHPRYTNFKNQKMMVFSGVFTANVILPPLIGIGKSVSRGYGTILPI